MTVQRRELCLVAAGMQVVHQQAHTNAAFGCRPQLAKQQLAGRIGLEHEVLQVERVARGADQRQPGRQRIGAVGQQAKARQVALIVRRRGVHQP